MPENSRERWVRETREATVRALVRFAVPASAAALEDELDLGTWTSIGLIGHRSAREVSAALRWAVAEGYAEPVAERDPEDPPGKLYTYTASGLTFANEHPKVTS